MQTILYPTTAGKTTSTRPTKTFEPGTMVFSDDIFAGVPVQDVCYWAGIRKHPLRLSRDGFTWESASIVKEPTSR